jgi:hypothetical protein
MNTRKRLEQLEGYFEPTGLDLHTMWRRNMETGELPDHEPSRRMILDLREALINIEFQDGFGLDGLEFEPTPEESLKEFQNPTGGLLRGSRSNGIGTTGSQRSAAP